MVGRVAGNLILVQRLYHHVSIKPFSQARQGGGGVKQVDTA